MLALRTFSKLYGLAGLRVGYGVGPAAVVAAIRKVQRGYDVGALAQVAALASLEDTAEVERRRAANRIAVADLTELLRARGLEPHPDSATNFVLVDVGADAGRDRRGAARGGGQRAVRGAVRGADVAADQRGLGGRSRAARRGPRCAGLPAGFERGVNPPSTRAGAAGASAILNRGRTAPLFV